MQGPHRLVVEEYTFKEPHVKYLQQALRSAGRFLLVQNLPPHATRRDLIQMFRGFKLLEGEHSGPCAAASPLVVAAAGKTGHADHMQAAACTCKAAKQQPERIPTPFHRC